jgi:hypothetical protein
LSVPDFGIYLLKGLINLMLSHILLPSPGTYSNTDTTLWPCFSKAFTIDDKSPFSSLM